LGQLGLARSLPGTRSCSIGFFSNHFFNLFFNLFFQSFYFVGGLLGPTFTTIIADQFKALKDGDRFFFTHTNGARAMGLDPAIQTMVMKRTLSDIICQNTGNEITGLQSTNVFRNDDSLIPCDDPSRSSLDYEAIAAIISQKKGRAAPLQTPSIAGIHVHRVLK
jgi:hypothetical protein